MPIYRFTGDVVFSPNLDDKGELQFTVPVEQLKSMGIELGKDVCIQVGFHRAIVEAGVRNLAYDALRDTISSFRGLPDLPHLRSANERSWDWSRADALYVYDLQLERFTPEEIANPDAIIAGVDQTNAVAMKAARRRRTKLRRILGLRSFVQAHPNLDIRCRDEMCPASRLIVGCNQDHFNGGVNRHGPGEGGVAVTYLTTTNQIHLKDLHSYEGAESYIAPLDVHGFDIFMMNVDSGAQANQVNPGTIVIHSPHQVDAGTIEEEIPF